MSYTGKANKGERQDALTNVKGLWGKVKGTFIHDRAPKEPVMPSLT